MRSDQLLGETIYAARLLARNKGFTIVAVATLALGIGASTAIFTVADAVLFRPLPYESPERLVKIWDRASREPTDNLSWPDVADLRAQRDVFEEVAADDGEDFDLQRGDGSRGAVGGAFITVDWLRALGVRPLLGRGFLPDEAGPGAARVALLSHAFWQRRFASSPAIVNTRLVIDNEPVTIVGVLPPNVLRYGADVLMPLVPDASAHDRSQGSLDVVARLKQGVTLARAQAALDTIARRASSPLAAPGTAPNPGADASAHGAASMGPGPQTRRGFAVQPLGMYYTSVPGHAGQGLWLMLGAVGLVLLIACANVTSLLLMRAVGRSRECVIRAALGASRVRLVRQLLVESLLLFVAGAALGMLVAGWSMDALLAFAVAGGYVPERLAVTLDARVLTFGLGLSLVAGVASGIVPAVLASAVDLGAALRASSLTLSGGVRRMRTSRLLIVSEIAVSLVLLVGSGLVVRSFLHLQATSAGIDAENLLITASDGGRDFPTAVTWWRTALDRTRQLPGVTFAAVTSRPPVHGARGLAFAVDASAAPAGEARAGDILISADYFRAMGIALLKGRTFTDRDGAGATPVAIVSQSLARRSFPDGEALGRRIRLDERSPLTCCSAAAPVDGVWREIVGIVADVRQARLEDTPAMTVYRPYSQIVEHDMFLVARAGSPEDAPRVAGLLRTHLLAMDPGRVWAEVRPMADVIGGSESIRLRRFALTILGTFAGLALLLSAGGTYGLLAYAVADRTREIGIRVALGATHLVVFRQVLGDALKLTAGGLALGAVAAWLSTRFVASLLFGVSAADPLTWLGAALVLSAIALLAGYAPARRAMRVDPLIALRQD